MDIRQSQALLERALRVLPGGVNSPVRSFHAVGGLTRFAQSGEGPYLTDVDGNRYIDYMMSWGPLILGHAYPAVLEAVAAAARHGTSFGASTRLEVELAEKVVEHVPGVEMLRMVNSGTEATMSALRLARAATSRDLVLKFSGCYHGHADALLVQPGSGAIGMPASPGIPDAVSRATLALPYNDLEAVERTFAEWGDHIAAVIVEPVAGNMGAVAPLPGFLQGLREVTRRHGSLLIFDEVITGFRLALGGAQAVFGVTPDLSCFGKIIGGGLPVGAYGGRRELMQMVAPSGPVYQAGTLSGNPLAMAAGLATISELERPGTYERLTEMAQTLAGGIVDRLRAAGWSAVASGYGSLQTAMFLETVPHGYEDARKADIERYGAFFRAMLEEGVWLPPAQFEVMFVSLAHTPELIERTLAAADRAIERMWREHP